MYKYLVSITFIFSVFCVNLYTQNYVNSPYSRYGIGDLVNTGFSYNRSLGGSSIALRPKNQINYMNPASYTTQDTMSFLFQAGFTGRITDISTGIDNDRASNANIEYLALAFPAAKWLNFSIGLSPYSRIQYLFRENLDTGDEIDNMSIEYSGNGGFNEFFLGTSFTVKEIVSLGVNAGYLFGSLEKIRSASIPQQITTTALVDVTEDYIANDFYFKLGLQVHPTYNEKHHFVFGFTYDTDSKIKVSEKVRSYREFTAKSPSLYYQDTLKYSDANGTISLPSKYAFGLTYNLNHQYIFTTEYITQKWSPSSTARSSSVLKKYNSYRFGIELNPAPLSIRTRQNYFKRMHYRLGGHFTQTYLSIAGQNINDYGISVGLGLPWRDSKKMYTNTSFNITYEFGIRGTTDHGLLKENYHIITLGFTLYDFWFLKSKYD